MKLKETLGNDLVKKKEILHHMIIKLWLFEQTACLGDAFLPLAVFHSPC